MDTIAVITLSSAIVGGLLGGLIAVIAFKIRELQHRLDEIQDERKTRRHTYATGAGLEDAIAVTIDLLIKQKADQARTESLLEILRQVRQGPHAYDQDRPAGKRPEGWDE